MHKKIIKKSAVFLSLDTMELKWGHFIRNYGMIDNKKPRNDVLLAEQASEQGLEITVDSNAKHRARITRFGTFAPAI